MLKFKHICTDIETLSVRPNSVIVSISAVKFNINSPEVETFEVNINPRASIDLGLHVDQDTLNWWKTKPEAAKAWMNSDVSIYDALQQYVEFCTYDDKIIHWCNGENFDFPILDSSMTATGLVPPWKYYNLRDMRTAFWLGNLDIFTEPRVGLYHVGIDDCLTQIAWLRKSLGVTLNG